MTINRLFAPGGATMSVPRLPSPGLLANYFMDLIN